MAAGLRSATRYGPSIMGSYLYLVGSVLQDAALQRVEDRYVMKMPEPSRGSGSSPCMLAKER